MTHKNNKIEKLFKSHEYAMFTFLKHKFYNFMHEWEIVEWGKVKKWK